MGLVYFESPKKGASDDIQFPFLEIVTGVTYLHSFVWLQQKKKWTQLDFVTKPRVITLTSC
jgi:hypothetical protein